MDLKHLYRIRKFRNILHVSKTTRGMEEIILASEDLNPEIEPTTLQKDSLPNIHRRKTRFKSAKLVDLSGNRLLVIPRIRAQTSHPVTGRIH